MKIIKINIEAVVADEADARDIINQLVAEAVTLDGVKYAEASVPQDGEPAEAKPSKPATEDVPTAPKPKRKYTRHVHMAKIDGEPATPVVTEVRT